MSHSLIPPSSAGIWGKPNGCTGWVLMAQTYPETEESVESKEGTASHEIAERMNWGEILVKDEIVESVASNGVVFTEEMYDAAELFAKDVTDVSNEHGVRIHVDGGVEARVEAKKIHEQSFGTTDAFLYVRAANKLYIWDYKFGYEVVEAFENWQSINYIAGLIEMLGISDPNTIVHIRIAQPRAFHRDGPIREWVVKLGDMLGYFHTLRENAHIALSPNSSFNSGSHCKHCPGRHACPAALKAGVGLYEVAAQPVPVELTPDALAVQYAIVQRAYKQLEYLKSGYEEQIKGLIRGGANVQGYRAEQGEGRERWAKPVQEVVAMGDMLGHDLRKGGAITPNQARKLGIDDAVIMAYSEKPKTGLKVVPDDGSKAKHVFSN